MRFTLERCVVRPWKATDEDALVRHANNWKVARGLVDSFPHPYTLEDARWWIGEQALVKDVTHFAIEVGGEAAGGIGFHRRSDVYSRTAGIGYWLGESVWGRGIATEALMAVSEFAFRSQPIVRLEAWVFEWNKASARVLEKAGYTLEGRMRRALTKQGVTYDAFMYARVLEDAPA